MGHTILFTSYKEWTKSDILFLYRSQDLLEKLLAILKNEINGGRLRVSSRAGTEGWIFLYFLSLILYLALSNTKKKHTLYSKWTVTETLMEMKKIRVVEISSGKQYLNEITKKQRTLFDQLSNPVPVGVKHSY